MKKLILVCMLLISIHSYAQKLVWAKTTGSPSDDMGLEIAFDSAGYMYTWGLFEGTVDFDLGPAVHTLNKDICGHYLLKSDTGGNFIWARELPCGTTSVVPDADGNIYVGGQVYTPIDCDPGPATYMITPVNGWGDGFSLKLNTAGDFMWAKHFYATVSTSLGSTSLDDIAIDARGDIYLTGNFSSLMDADPGPDTFFLDVPFGSHNTFTTKLTPEGNFIEAWPLGEGTDITVRVRDRLFDKQSNSYITGIFSGKLDFHAGADSVILTSEGTDMFIVKQDSGGHTLWAKKIGSQYMQDPRFIRLDDLDNVLISGVFTTVVDFDPGPGTHQMISNGGQDIFILKLDTSGNFIWVRDIGAEGDLEYPSGMSVSLSGNVYITGMIHTTLGANSYLTSDFFISKLNPEGTTEWQHVYTCPKQLGMDPISGGIALHPNQQHIYTTGGFSGTINATPWANEHTITSNDWPNDIYLFKLDDCSLTFIRQPDSLFVYRGDTTQFICQASSAGASYRWQQNDGSGFVDIPDSGIFSGATNDTLTLYNTPASLSHYTYRCVITELTCTDTSQAGMLLVSSPTGVERVSVKNMCHVYPNPAASTITIEMPAACMHTEYMIYDLLGVCIYTGTIGNLKTTIDVAHLPTGIYVIRIQDANSCFRIMKQ